MNEQERTNEVIIVHECIVEGSNGMHAGVFLILKGKMEEFI